MFQFSSSSIFCSILGCVTQLQAHTSEQVRVLTLLAWVLEVELWHFGWLTWFWCGSRNSACVCMYRCVCRWCALLLRPSCIHNAPPSSLCLHRSNFVSLKYRYALSFLLLQHFRCTCSQLVLRDMIIPSAEIVYGHIHHPTPPSKPRQWDQHLI